MTSETRIREGLLAELLTEYVKPEDLLGRRRYLGATDEGVGGTGVGRSAQILSLKSRAKGMEFRVPSRLTRKNRPRPG